MLKREWLYFRKNGELFTLSLPGLIYKLIFAYLPMIGIVIAFKHFRNDKGIFGSEWVGFKNFEYLFTSDVAWRITRNTILYNLAYMTLTTITALVFAIMLNEVRKRWLKVFQTSMFLPYFLSWVLVGYIVYAFLNHSDGFINRTLTSLGLDGISWYQDPAAWPYILILAHLWKAIGFSTLVYFAGILGIDTEYYEAARMDGASKLQMTFSITLPLLLPLVIILGILSIGGMFKGDFGLHYFIPNNSGFIFSTTDIIDTYAYRALREIGDISMAAAVGLYQSIVGFVLVLVTNSIVRRVNSENSLW